MQPPYLLCKRSAWRRFRAVDRSYWSLMAVASKLDRPGERGLEQNTDLWHHLNLPGNRRVTVPDHAFKHELRANNRRIKVELKVFSRHGVSFHRPRVSRISQVTSADVWFDRKPILTISTTTETVLLALTSSRSTGPTASFIYSLNSSLSPRWFRVKHWRSLNSLWPLTFWFIWPFGKIWACESSEIQFKSRGDKTLMISS